MTPQREVRAAYDDQTIRVYQAYNDAIAVAALSAGTLVAPFKRSRMTWIKPSFLWMMYRSGWARKDADQHRILALDISRTGFEWALRNSCLSDAADRFGAAEARRLMDASPVRVQWDPERDLHHNPLEHRSIQIGLSGEAVDRYVDDWISAITDVTAAAHEIGAAVQRREFELAASLLPQERPYPLPGEVAARLETDQGDTDG